MKIHFLIFTILIILWSFSLYFYNHLIFFSAWDWLKITFSLTLILIFELFCFIISISNVPFKKFKIPLVISAILGLTIILSLFINNGGLIIKNYLMTLRPQGGTFLLSLLSYVSLGVAILFEKSLKGPHLSHLRTVYILVGFGVLLITFNVLYIFLPLITGQKKYFWLGPVFAFLFLLSYLLGHYLIREIEKRKKAEKLAKEWEELAKAKDQFLLFLQHHLRTPIGPLKGYLERILEGTYGHEENPVIKEKLIEMRKLTDTIYSLIENLLDIQQLRMGKKILNLEDFQIENLIEGIIEELKPEAEQKGLYLKYEIIPLPPVRLDKKKIREVIWNLVDNAIKYSNRGGVIIRLKIQDQELSSSYKEIGKGQWVKIEIEDTGIGMEKEEIEYFLKGKLFERGEEAKKLYGPGRGIGLAAAIEFIKAHGGKIWAESKGRGEGTTFFIKLPLHITNDSDHKYE